MSEQQLTIEKPKRSLKHKAMKAGAVVFSGLALGAASAPSASAESEGRNRPPDQEEIQPKLKNINELPGYRIKVGPEARSKLQTSTVEIITNIKFTDTSDAESHWFPGCTGVKITLPGGTAPYIMTAGHCFSEATGSKYGEFTDPLNPTNKAENFINRYPHKLGIADPSVPYNNRLDNPMWLIDGLSINTNYKDIALLRPAPPAQNGGSLPGRSFNNIPAISLKISERAPIPGEQVALYGVPSANNFEPVIGSGTFIGRLREPMRKNQDPQSISYKLLDVVIINPDAPNKDNCNFGASGSMAIRADGSMLGPLSGRINGGYGPNKEFQNGAAFLGETPEMFNSWTDHIEKSLKVKLPKDQDMTLCFYTVLDKTTLANLVGGFNTFAPDLTPADISTSEGKG